MKVTYTINWMGPVSTRWYEDHNIPYVITEGHKDFTSYSGGRIDIRGLDEGEYWCGWHEYDLSPMLSEDWDALSDWLYNMQTEELWERDKLIEHLQYWYGKEITWANQES